MKGIANLKERFLLFGLICISTFVITYFLASLIEGQLSIEPYVKIEMYYFIFLQPFLLIIFLNVDLSEKELLDEYLYLVISSILFGLFLADFMDFMNEIIKYLKSDEIYLLILFILVYLYLVMMFRETIKLKTKKRNV